MRAFYKKLAILLLMKKMDYTELGATLFVPFTHKDREAIAHGEKYPQLGSVVIDTEDGVNAAAFSEAAQSLQAFLQNIKTPKPYLFIRPRNAAFLEELLGFEGIEKVDGFILPKFSLTNAAEYLDLLHAKDFLFMPSIEGGELFSQTQLLTLRALLLPYKEQIPLVRFGLEDMLRQLGMRRECKESVFDMSAPAFALGGFIAAFKSVGFAISGGVYPCFSDRDGFERDVKRDLKEGLFSKTIIHPSQIEVLSKLYRVDAAAFDEALQIYMSDEAAFAQNAKMAEKSTMTPHAIEIIKRAQVYGLSLPEQSKIY
ncbi:MAG: HpcH/HpaI aldolase/citrate lyase family protein [Sulfurimonas sp.]|nr:HpcH/HpaI aldolase/citrate lyase family protein [Sulfurimonas sp.]MDD3061111.1 HpcH/HpaI aldolase/citrate lyase family protein [Sulfurimonas sp.]MDD5203314.1 HpcH/HpaI aldolase/citrate lyase family protein [Sulfurimonas sp.]